jgi:Undecaprenyl-phosphate galactose phosphotransferase WbaP
MISKIAAPAVAPRIRPVESERPPESHRTPPSSLRNVSGGVRYGTRNGWPTRIALATADVLAIALALCLARLALVSLFGNDQLDVTRRHFQLAAVFTAAYVALAQLQGLYAAVLPRPAPELRQSLAVAAFTTLIVCGLMSVPGTFASLDILWLAAVGVLTAIFVPAYRAACRTLFGRSRWWGVRVIVVGSGGLAAKAFEQLDRRPQCGLRPIGYVDDHDVETSAIDPILFLGTPDMLGHLTRELGVNRAVLAAHTFDADDLGSLVSRPSTGIEHWLVLPAAQGFPSLWAAALEVAGMPALAVGNPLASSWKLVLKRISDLTLTLLLGIPAIPIFALLIVLIRCSSPGSVFYSQERIGRHGRRFRAWKFRTMLPNADEVLERHLADNPELMTEWQATHKLKRDPRITWIGNWLRKSSLDELPQVWNVMCGEMSLVGPRPIVEAEIDKYADQYEQYANVLPGITGLWQISGRNNTTYRERVDFDEYYVKNWSPWLDIYILACTVKVVLLREGAY